MKHLALSFTAVFFLLCFSFNASAEKNGFYQQAPIDTVPKKIIQKVRITVKDLMDGSALDSVYVTAGLKRGYTDKKGIVEFDSVPEKSNVIISKAGYLAVSKKANADLTIRLSTRDIQSSASNYKNGLYERPIEQFSGSATIVSGNDLRKVNSLSFVEALKYYDPSFVVLKNNNYGDDPNSTPSVRIRGAYNFPAAATIPNQGGGATVAGAQVNPSVGDFIASHIANPDQPVVLLNGIQVSLQTALDIDINRIDKITILKDAAATAQYGVRGGTGVLLIQTKLPQKGVLNVTYSGQVQVSTADLSSYHLLDAPVKLQLEHDNGFYAGNPSLYQSRLDAVNKGVNTNWLEIPTRTGIGNKHYLNLDGGDDDINYGLDFSYNSIQGVMKGSDRKNMNFGGYINTRIKNLVINNYLTYLRSNSSNSPYGSFSDYPLQNGYWDPYDPVTGGMKRVLEEYTHQGNTVKFYNPAYNGILSTTDDRAYSRLSNLTSLNWTIGHGFKVDGRFGITRQSDIHDLFLPPSHTTFANYTANEFFKRGQYNQTTSEFLSWEGVGNLHYTKKLGLHQFYGSAGASVMETKSESAEVQLSGFTSDKFSDIAFGNAYSNSRPQTGKIVTRLGSVYGNFTYSYDNRYQLEASANADASSQFGDDSRIADHYSVGASWNLHNEKFFQQIKFINQLRFRASTGTTGSQYFQSYLGNTNFDYYTDRQYISGTGNATTRGVGLGAYITSFANDSLRSPETRKENIGMDAVLFGERLSVRLDVYRNRTKNLVLPIVSPSSTGFTGFTYYNNMGGIKNEGIEFDLNYTIIKNTRKGINWSVRVNGLHNQDRILALSGYVNKVNEANDAMTTDQTRPQPRYVIGQSLTGIWAVRSLGIDPATGKEKFVRPDGSETFTWTASDKIFAGDVQPDWLGSFGTVLSVKNISAGIYFNYQVGAQYYNQTLADRLENADLTYNVDRRAAGNRWVQPGDQALYKPLSVNGLATSPTYATTRFIEKNDFINCSAIALGYSLSQNMAQKIGAKNIKLGLMANNVFRSETTSGERGFHYPYQRMYSFSLTAGF